MNGGEMAIARCLWVTLKSREPFAFPGLWDCWVDRDSGSQLHTFTIITTRANGLVRRIHDRMPVIYDVAMGRQWLDGPFGERAMALDLCAATASLRANGGLRGAWAGGAL
jgi:putative SOS response-associated peptidase YedK